MIGEINKKLFNKVMLTDKEILLKCRKFISRHSVRRLRLINTGEVTKEKQSFLKLSTHIIESQKLIIKKIIKL